MKNENMCKVVQLKSVKSRMPIIESLDNLIVSEIYEENIKQSKVDEYSLIMNLISQKKQEKLRLRDTLIFELVFKYGFDYEMLSKLTWGSINLKKGIVEISSKINIHLKDNLKLTLLKYQNICTDKSNYVFLTSKEQAMTKQTLKNLYNRYKKKIREIG